MTFLRTLKIRSQLFMLLAAVFSLFLVSAIVSNQAVNKAKAEFTRFITQDQQLLLNYTELYANGLQMGQALRNIILDPANSKAYEHPQGRALPSPPPEGVQETLGAARRVS